MNPLRPLELTYRLINRIRRTLYRHGWLKARRLPRPVISVGNLAMGGTGKTPMVIAVGKELMSRGKKVTVLSRGYGRANSAPWERVATEDPGRYGDEPVTIARALAGADVVVGSDRFRAGSGYLAGNDCDLFLLDDGFQHLELHRDADVVLVDLLVDSAFRLQREGPSALSDANIVVSRIDRAAEPATGTFVSWLEPRVFTLGGTVQSVEALRGKRVASFSGLANNVQFSTMLTGLGATLVREFSFPDHARYSESQTVKMKELAAAQGAEFLITTEKDFVKVADPDIAWISVEMVVSPRGAFFDRLEQLLRAAPRA